MAEPPDSNLIFGVLIGVAWVLREVLPLMLKRRNGNGKNEPPYLPKDEDKRREDEWLSWRREVVNKRLDAHHDEITELRERVVRLEAEK